MMINCPRCGFSQPKDQYCASCGVDMQNYRPSAPPLWKMILVNPAFLITLSFAVVMGSVTFIRQKQREELASRAELLKSGPLIVDQTEIEQFGEAAPQQKLAKEDESLSDTSKSISDEHSQTLESSKDESHPQVSLASTNTLHKEAAANAAATANAAKNPASAETKSLGEHKKDTLQAKIYYTEVSVTALDNFEEESRSLGGFTDFGDFRAGPILDIQKKMNRESGVVVLHQTTKDFSTKNPNQQWFLGRRHSDGSDIGVTTFLSIEGTSERLRGEIELLRSFIEIQGTEQGLRKISSPQLNFEISDARMGYMVRMPLPRQIAKDPAGLSPEGIMRIFSSESFQNQSSEFTLFIDFDTPNP